MFTLDAFAFSAKEQIRSPKEVYAIDAGLAGAVGSRFSENQGRLLENAVFLELIRRGFTLYYYKTGNGLEVDFACHAGG